MLNTKTYVYLITSTEMQERVASTPSILQSFFNISAKFSRSTIINASTSPANRKALETTNSESARKRGFV